MRFTIALDGPAASGKGTIGRALAEHFGFGHLDTGLLYRAVGRRYMDGIEAVEAAMTLDVSTLDPAVLRVPEVAVAASKVAAIPEVRAALVDLQRAFARRAGGAVLDGRDIGTVICPEAEAKLFITASAETRATRRFREQVAAGHDVPYEDVLTDVRERDARDMGRKDAPLRPAEDAITLDTSDLSVDEAIVQAIAAVESRSAS